MVQRDEAALAGEIIRQVIGELPAEVTQILDKGTANSVFAVETKGRRLIVRMRDEPCALLEYKKEAWCIENVSALGIPGPTVLAVGTFGTVPYMVQTLIPGVNGEDAPAHSLHVWRELGRYTRLFHSIQLPANGETLSDAEHEIFGAGITDGEWPRFITYNLDSLTPTDELLTLGVYAAEHREAIVSIFEGLKSMKFKYGLSHGDLAPRNVIIDSQGRVSLLDWGAAGIRFTPEVDISTAVGRHPDDENRDAFMEGYGFQSEELAALLPRFEAYHLIKSFDLVRWSIDHCPEELPSYVQRAKTALRLALHLPRY